MQLKGTAATLAKLRSRRVGVLGFDGVAALDLTGPLEAFAAARPAEVSGATEPAYRPIMIGLTHKSFTSDSGIGFRADSTVASVGPLDTILIPGGKGLQEAETRRLAAAWLAAQGERTRRIAAISTGLYALAQSGLVDGRMVTTHWRFCSDLARLFPKLRINAASVFLKDDRFYTSAGGRAGIEMAICLIQEDLGTETALAVARELVMELRPPGDSEPFVELPACFPGPSDRVASLPVWIASHLTRDLSVETLAERTGICRRHFTRLFHRVFNESPANFVEQLRLNEARRRLLMPHHSVESVGLSVGYRSADAFRRAFERRFGITPNEYRNRFFFRAASDPAIGRAARAQLVSQIRVNAA